jgi:hypothetical protein
MSLPNVVVISNNTTDTSLTINLANIQAGTRYYIRYDGSLTSLTFDIPITWSNERKNWYIYIKNGSINNVNIFRTIGGNFSVPINNGVTTVRNSTIYTLTNNQNNDFMYIYWTGTSLILI